MGLQNGALCTPHGLLVAMFSFFESPNPSLILVDEQKRAYHAKAAKSPQGSIMDAISFLLFICMLVFAFMLFKPKGSKRPHTRREVFAISSTSVIGPRINQLSCSRCGSDLRLQQVEGDIVDGIHRRTASTLCVEKNHQEIILFHLKDS